MIYHNGFVPVPCLSGSGVASRMKEIKLKHQSKTSINTCTVVPNLEAIRGMIQTLSDHPSDVFHCVSYAPAELTQLRVYAVGEVTFNINPKPALVAIFQLAKRRGHS